MAKSTKKLAASPAPRAIRPLGRRVWVRYGTFVLAATDDAVLFDAFGEAPVIFVPRRDLPADFLHDEGRIGEPRAGRAARYWSFSVGGQIVSNGTWSFEKPKGEFAELVTYVAFDPAQVQIEIEDERVAQD